MNTTQALAIHLAGLRVTLDYIIGNVEAGSIDKAFVTNVFFNSQVSETLVALLEIALFGDKQVDVPNEEVERLRKLIAVCSTELETNPTFALAFPRNSYA